MKPLAGTVAVVTGASRGVGRGVALGLGEAGATVYATGRSTRAAGSAAGDGVAGTIDDTADEVSALGGVGVAVRCDHRDDAQVEALFRRVDDERGRIDLLVNAAWGGYEGMVEGGEFTWERPFWEQPTRRWDAMFAAGVRAAYVAGQHAARRMVAARAGLIVALSYWAARKYKANVAYGVAKAATDRMIADMALELAPHGVAAVALYPGLVRTERVEPFAAYLDLGNAESPRFVGRAVAALAADPRVREKSGRALVAAELAEEYGFVDVDGRRPRPLSLDEA